MTRLLEAAGERIHPSSARLANESRHIEAESDGHDLHVFEAFRRMDEILIANFMRFQEGVKDDDYDLMIADEAWDVDYFWHEHPELKRAPLAWFTDFVGFLPMPERRRARRLPDRRLQRRDDRAHRGRAGLARSRDLRRQPGGHRVDTTMGPNLPASASGPRALRLPRLHHRPASGDFGAKGSRARALGYRPDERVCIVTVGGSGVGRAAASARAAPPTDRQARGCRSCG